MADIRTIKASSRQAGRVIEQGDGKRFICAYWDAGAKALTPDTILRGRPVAIANVVVDSINGPWVIIPVALAVYQYIAVSLATLTVAGWYWFQLKGACEALVLGTGAAPVAADAIECIAASQTADVGYFQTDSVSAAARSTSSVGVAVDAQIVAAATLSTVWLDGDRVIVT